MIFAASWALAHAHGVGGDLVVGPLGQPRPVQSRCDLLLGVSSSDRGQCLQVLSPGQMSVAPRLFDDRPYRRPPRAACRQGARIESPSFSGWTARHPLGDPEMDCPASDHRGALMAGHSRRLFRGRRMVGIGESGRDGATAGKDDDLPRGGT